MEKIAWNVRPLRGATIQIDLTAGGRWFTGALTADEAQQIAEDLLVQAQNARALHAGAADSPSASNA